MQLDLRESDLLQKQLYVQMRKLMTLNCQSLVQLKKKITNLQKKDLELRSEFEKCCLDRWLVKKEKKKGHALVLT